MLNLSSQCLSHLDLLKNNAQRLRKVFADYWQENSFFNYYSRNEDLQITLWEEANHLYVLCSVPYNNLEKIKVRLEGFCLVVEAEKEMERHVQLSHYTRTEKIQGKLTQKIFLPPEYIYAENFIKLSMYREKLLCSIPKCVVV